MIDFGYENFHTLEDEHPELVPITMPDYMDSTEWETFIHTMPQEYLEIVVCLYLGLKTEEIVQALQLPNTARLYNLNARMRHFYKKQKTAYFEL